MNELEITYGIPKTQKVYCLVAGGYMSLYGLYKCVQVALTNYLSFEFYLALAAVIFGAILILAVTLWAQKPLAKLNSELIYVNMPSLKTIYSAEWINVKEVGIGVSYLALSETDGKTYNVDISDLKYTDLKELKSRVIEICEAKHIPYHNN